MLTFRFLRGALGVLLLGGLALSPAAAQIRRAQIRVDGMS